MKAVNLFPQWIKKCIFYSVSSLIIKIWIKKILYLYQSRSFYWTLHIKGASWPESFVFTLLHGHLTRSVGLNEICRIIMADKIQEISIDYLLNYRNWFEWMNCIVTAIKMSWLFSQVWLLKLNIYPFIHSSTFAPVIVAQITNIIANKREKKAVNIMNIQNPWFYY